jgi:glycosyltransferase involved in cell wall biosynthesis
MQYWTPEKSLEQEFWQRRFLRQHGSFDLDLTYTVPQNFPQRFLSSSKCKMAIYAYESSIMPEHWSKFYHLVDYILPPSKYVADMMERNGCPKDKIVVVPHGVDTELFNPDAAPLPVNTSKKVKFLCVAEPHYRKQLDKLLKVYCENFTCDDDVCLVLKTKIFKNKEKKKEFEMDLVPVIKQLQKKYGKKMPEVKIISKRLNNIAGLYTACDAFVLMTASEGWGVPYLEALACGIPVIAPRFGGQLQFLNDSNALLTACSTRRARKQEQYWGAHPKATVGNPDEKEFGKAMVNVYQALQGKDEQLYKQIERNIKNGLEDANNLTWKNAMQQIINLANKTQ